MNPSPQINDRLDKATAVRIIIFTSPKAGSGAGRDQIPKLQTLLEEAGASVTIAHSVDLLMDSVGDDLEGDAERPIVVAAGGDGTLALAAQSVPPDVPLVPMPMGTENLLAKHFVHRADAGSVCSVIRFGDQVSLDAGLATSAEGRANKQPRLFLIMASCGFDAEVVRGMHLTRRGHINRFSYAKPIVRALFRYQFPKLRVRVDGQPIPDSAWCMVFNISRYATNLKIEPDAKGDDGKLDLIALEKGSLLSGLRYLGGVVTGRHLNMNDVNRQRGCVIELDSDARVPYQLDGDYVGHLPLRIEIKPARVQLLIPNQPATDSGAGSDR